MPYAQRDAFHRSMRQFLSEQCVGLSPITYTNYENWIGSCGELVEYQRPNAITLLKMREIEAGLDVGETSKVLMCSTFRAFLRWSGNRDAFKWKLTSHMRPKEDGVFFNEQQTAYVRTAAQQLGTEHELIYSLGIDNGLRTIDMRRLTPAMVDSLIKAGEAMIIGKGRNGGKPGKLVLNKMTYGPLVKYMRIREGIVREHGADPEQFLIRWDKRKGVIPFSYKLIYDWCREYRRHAVWSSDLTI